MGAFSLHDDRNLLCGLGYEERTRWHGKHFTTAGKSFTSKEESIRLSEGNRACISFVLLSGSGSALDSHTSPMSEARHNDIVGRRGKLLHQSESRRTQMGALRYARYLRACSSCDCNPAKDRYGMSIRGNSEQSLTSHARCL